MSENQQQFDAISQTGKRMWFFAWLIGISLLTMYFGDVVEQQNNPNQSPSSYQSSQVTEVTLQRNRFGHYVTSGTINQQPVIFLLDTGATLVAVPESVAKRLDLPKGAPHQVRTANGIATAYATRLDSLTIGELTVYDVPASINPGMDDDEILLGMSVLKHIEFTQRNNTLVLRQYHN